jgi:hypothetical protein
MSEEQVVKTITCDIDGVLTEVPEDELYSFVETYEDENECMNATGWKLRSTKQVVQRSAHMQLKKWPVGMEGMTAIFQ